jgi:hypothetical protein
VGGGESEVGGGGPITCPLASGRPRRYPVMLAQCFVVADEMSSGIGAQIGIRLTGQRPAAPGATLVEQHDTVDNSDWGSTMPGMAFCALWLSGVIAPVHTDGSVMGVGRWWCRCVRGGWSIGGRRRGGVDGSIRLGV